MSETQRLSTPAAILEAAAHVLADRDVSMGEVAAAAGIGRATLYRHYPTREALLVALANEATAELADRLRDAGLDAAPFPVALERLGRALLAVGDRYVVLVRERARADRADTDRLVRRPLQQLFARGVDEGHLRADLSVPAQVRLFTSLVTGALDVELQRELGIDEAAARLASVFLDGARAGRSAS